MKNFRHHLDEFFMITPANLFEFSTSATCVQVQSDLYIQKLWLRDSGRHRLGHTSMQTEKKKKEGTHVEPH